MIQKPLTVVARAGDTADTTKSSFSSAWLVTSSPRPLASSEARRPQFQRGAPRMRQSLGGRPGGEGAAGAARGIFDFFLVFF